MFKRKYIRFKAADGTIAKFQDGAGNDISALVITESFGGLSCVVTRESSHIKGDRIKVSVGPVGPILAEVAWVKHLDEEISTIGIKLLE